MNDDEAWDDSEDADFDDADGADTVPCPYCRAPIHEDAERCPECENYISREDAPSRVPLWIKLTALLCLLAAICWAVGC